MKAKHPIDIYVGKRLRKARLLFGISQKMLGEKLNITFQQIQKYETGSNRIGCSRIYELSKILKVNINYFFDDFNEESFNDNFDKDSHEINNNVDQNQSEINSMNDENEDFVYKDFNIQNREMLSLIRSYKKIRDKDVRSNIISLIKSLEKNQ